MTGEYDTLFICASFFGYAKAIIGEFEKRGHHVAWFEDRPGTDTLTKAMVRVFPKLTRGHADDYFDRIIERLRTHPISTVFVIKGEALSVASLQALRRAFPKARFVLYFWDSYRNMPKGSEEKVQYFDDAFTFDPANARSDPRLRYRPLFYLADFTQLPHVQRDIDILFIGTVHSDRHAVLRRVERAIPQGVAFTQMLYYPSRNLYRIKRAVRPSWWRAGSAQTLFKPLSRAEILALVARAKIIVDIERSVQSGYTIRTIETIAAQRKLITTNPRVTEADFYRPANHLHIDRHHPVITPEFVQNTYEPISKDIVERYSIKGWFEEILYSDGGAGGDGTSPPALRATPS